MSKSQPREKCWSEESRNNVREANRRRKGNKRINEGGIIKEISLQN